MYGVGQGLNEGVQMAAGFLTDAMKMKQQQKRFDQSMEQSDRHHKDSMDRYYDRLALEQAWIDASVLRSPHQAPASTPPQAPAQAAPPAIPSALPSMGPAPRAQSQVTIRPMPMTPARALLPTPRFVAKPAREFMPSTMSASYPRWRQ